MTGPRGGRTTQTKSGLVRTMVYLGREELSALRQDARALQEVSDGRVGVTTVVREVVRQHYGLDGEK